MAVAFGWGGEPQSTPVNARVGCIAFAAMCLLKEDIALLGIAFSVGFLLDRRQRRTGVMLFSIAATRTRTRYGRRPSTRRHAATIAS